MTSSASKDLNKIINDKTSGSTEIVFELNEFFHIHADNLRLINLSFNKAQEKLSHFAVIKNYLNQLQKIIRTKNSNNILDFTNNFKTQTDKKYQRLYNHSRKYLSNCNYILTLSNSATLLEIFKYLRKDNNKLKIIIAESRPRNEGRLFAHALVKNNIKVEFITDAMISLYIPKIDAAVLGADVILKNGNIINKTGSKAAALLCKHLKKPCYVITTRDKISFKTKFHQDKQNPEEIWKTKNRSIKITNYYFEEVEKNLITKIITD
jgi:translation initiation factor eIF-2B subunit delta